MAGWWQREQYQARRRKLLARQGILRALKAWFEAEAFLEAETPALQVSPGLEPHLKAFRTELEGPDGSLSPLYLHTSPEFALKKLLAAGEPKLFSFARVFRNGERSATHHPEFTLLEWYRAGADYLALMDDCEEILRRATKAAGVTQLTWQGRACDPFQPFERLSVQEAFIAHAGVDLLATIDDPKAPSPGRLAAELKRLGLRFAADDSWADLVTRLQLQFIEPKLGRGRPTLLYDYPVSLAALSRAKPEAPHLAERVELYVEGLELANGFSELTDATEQRRRFEADMELKEQLYGLRYPIDEDFLKALEVMPPAAGMALGFDRLAMLATGAARIEEVLWAEVAGGDS